MLIKKKKKKKETTPKQKPKPNHKNQPNKNPRRYLQKLGKSTPLFQKFPAL